MGIKLFTLLALDQNSILPIGDGSQPLRSMMKGCSVLSGVLVTTAGCTVAHPDMQCVAGQEPTETVLIRLFPCLV